MRPIYLDHCSTTPLDPVVLDAMMPFLREWFGNPSTPHQIVGGVVERAIREAREATAALITCQANELIWTSGATESNNLAILGTASSVRPGKRHIIRFRRPPDAENRFQPIGRNFHHSDGRE